MRLHMDMVTRVERGDAVRRSAGELLKSFGVVPCCGCGEPLLKARAQELTHEEHQELELLGIRTMSVTYRDRYLCTREAQTSGICLE